MTLPTVDTRKAWLDEVSLFTSQALMKITQKELTGTQITSTEAKYAKLCSAYLYLYKLAEENQILRPDDPDNPFNFETLH